jgi:hypothetical protein
VNKGPETAGNGVLFLSPEEPKNQLGLPNEVWVFRPEDPPSSLAAYLDQHYGGGSPWVTNVTERSREAADVPGASEAFRLEGDGRTKAPTEVTIRQWAIIAISRDGTLIELWCRGAVEDFHAQACEDVFNSLCLT